MFRLNTGDPADARRRTTSGCRRRLSPGSRTAAGSPTTSSRSSCGRSPALTYPLIDKTYSPDTAAGELTDGTAPGPNRYLAVLPVRRHALRRLRHPRLRDPSPRARGPSGSGSVVLDLGPGAGRPGPAHAAGAERLRDRGQHPGPPRARTLGSGRGSTAGGTQHAAVYPALAPGDYVVWHDAGTPAMTVTIAGGRVTTAWWPGPADAPTGRCASWGSVPG